MCTKYSLGAGEIFSVSVLAVFELVFRLFLCYFFETETEKFSNLV